MTETTSAKASQAKSVLTKIAAFVTDRNIPFLVCSIGMIVMLLWAGKFKMTAPGAEGILPLVSPNPLVRLQFTIFLSYFLLVFFSGNSRCLDHIWDRISSGPLSGQRQSS